jgi:carbon-monoxide dehydrogenase large subunit
VTAGRVRKRTARSWRPAAFAMWAMEWRSWLSTLSQALDAAEAVQVIYEPLPATTRPGDLSTVPIWSEAPDNLCFDWGTGDAAACDRLFATAIHVTRLRFEIPRIVVHPMEPRTAVGQYDPAC